MLAEALAEKVLGEGNYDGAGDASRASELRRRCATSRSSTAWPAPGDTRRSGDTAYRVVADDFVSLEDGTGIVHIAPAYGDLEIGRKYGLLTCFRSTCAALMADFGRPGSAGKFFKDADRDVITRTSKSAG